MWRALLRDDAHNALSDRWSGYMRPIRLRIDGHPPAKSEALSILGPNHPHADRVVRLLEAARGFLADHPDAGCGDKPIRMEVVVGVSPTTRSDATNYLGGIGDVLQRKGLRGSLPHLGELAGIHLFNDDRQIAEVDFRFEPADEPSYTVVLACTEMATWDFTAEEIGYWYFRLNGFLAIPNFVVHPDEGSNQRTDVDIIGVRFPHRSELVRDPLQDHAEITKLYDDEHKPLMVFAEVKKSQCRLNGPWTTSSAGNMQRVLGATGIVPTSQHDVVAQSLYESGRWSDSELLISLFCLGSDHNRQLARDYPGVPQVLWPDALSFIFDRFRAYRLQKSRHDQWPESGKRLWERVWAVDDVKEFVQATEITGNG